MSAVVLPKGEPRGHAFYLEQVHADNGPPPWLWVLIMVAAALIFVGIVGR